MSEYIVEMKNITKKFPGIVANDGISIRIKKGEIFAILGENGAGKSTLMSILFGMYEPDEGEIYIRGRREKISSPRYAAKLQIGMVHQHYKLVSDFTVTENIILGMEPKRKIAGILPFLDKQMAEKKVVELSSRYGLKTEPKKRIQELDVSGQQRVEILKMLYREAEILIFDEPTAILTEKEIVLLLKIMQELKKAGKTIILISHKLEEIKKTADRCAILCKGKLIGVFQTESITTKEMASKMVGHEISVRIDKKKAELGQEILSIQNLTVKNTKGLEAVKEVSLSIRGGEILAIAGVDGNGQRELADSIVGLLPACAGKIIFKGQDITDEGIRKRIEKGIAYVPEDRQRTGLILDFSLKENLILKNYREAPFSQKGRMYPEKIRAWSEKMIEKYDIRSSRGSETKVRFMSGGNQQKILLAREVEQNASLLIFYQPARGVDIGAMEKIHRQILNEREKGKAILLISMELEEIINLADTIAVMYNGEIQSVFSGEDISIKELGESMTGVKIKKEE